MPSYQLHSILVRNFFRYSDTPQTTFVPPGDTEVLIIGNNLDTNGSDSNGTSKSALLEAVSWALTGKVLKDIPVDGIIRRGTEECGVTVCLKEEGSEIYHSVIRNRGKKGESLRYIIQDGRKTHDITRRTTSQTQEEILRAFNLDDKKYFTDIINTVYFSSATVDGFASKNTGNRERMELLTRFLNLGNFDKASDQAKVLMKSNQDSLTLVNMKLAELEKRKPPEFPTFQAYDADLDQQILNYREKKQEWDEYRTHLLEQKVEASKIAQLYQLVESIQQRIKMLDSQLTAKAKVLSDISTRKQLKANAENYFEDYKDLKESELSLMLEEARKQLEDTVKQCSKIEIELQRILKQAEKPLVCPNCNTSLHLHNDALELLNLEVLLQTADILRKSLMTSKERLAYLRKLVTETQEKLKAFTNLKNDVERQTELLQGVIERLDAFDKDGEEKRKELDKELEEATKKIPESIDPEELIDTNLEEADTQIAEINQIIGQLKNVKTSIQEAVDQIVPFKQEAEEYQSFINAYSFWMLSFGQIKQAVIDNYLPIFESEINRFLDILNTGMSVRLALEKEKKSGGVKQEFQIIVMDEHGEEAAYEQFSEGEMKRIALCVGFALRAVSMARNSMSFNFTLFDEIFDGLDDTGKNEFFKLLKTIPGQKLIISHSDSFKSQFEHVIEIVRKDGIATIAA